MLREVLRHVDVPPSQALALLAPLRGRQRMARARIRRQLLLIVVRPPDPLGAQLIQPVAIRARGGRAAPARTSPGAEDGHDADDQRFEGGERRAHDGEVGFDAAPVRGRGAVVGRVVGMLLEDVEGVDAQAGHDADEPADGEDAQEGGFLAPWDLEAPDAADGDDGDEEVGEDVDGGVDVPDAAVRLIL